MSDNKNISRRSFLKSTGSGAAGLTILGTGINSVFSGQKKMSAWTNNMQINPEIKNTMVVCCHNPEFFTDEAKATVANDFKKQNECINTSRVETDMDGMAVALSGKKDPKQAWATIFRKPSTKEWEQVKAALKVNCIYQPMMPKIAIVGKVCKELIRLGVKPENITIYDACHNAYGNGKYNSYVGSGIPDGVKVANQQASSAQTTKITVGSNTLECSNIVLESDILVNCAVNKGHSFAQSAKFTLTMKNHTGSMKLKCPSDIEELINENKSDAILGGDPVRQQLCIVDSLWAAKTGPLDPATHLPARIIMGTFGPAVDIAVVRNVREKIMNASHDNDGIKTILTSFGLEEKNIEWIEVPPYDPISFKKANTKKNESNFCIVINNGMNNAEAHFKIPSGQVLKVDILDLKGRAVYTLMNSLNEQKVVWDGTTNTGLKVKSGTYLIRITGKNFTRSQQIRIF